ncbi:hypothetical protein SAMN02745135_02037 [Caloranaerobacter azorensis DSM 13643]|uniref:Uncharacterized protein n=1 Tax=Caloranaerobacter azorensis DSM 13643 TaxID=1121264 RepID=A0A1M5VNT2_9FIRM|nr:DUF6765 family protein [Caloranaerobacter azorensis]SHH76916.1 hypothetical protein SAMN02745135_02037 [Caloranaerobacter azorensis DSM 13643]
MKIDFHFYTIYVLCRLAGIKHEYSKKIAYASQHTDDAKYDHELEFISGGRFQQQMSAHKFLDLGVFSKKTGYDIFLPFHFLPGIEGKDFYEKLLCRANSRTAKEMLKDTLNTLNKPYGIHRLGIALHVYADTWSHQNFHGLYKFHNKVDDIELENKEQSEFQEIEVELKSTFLPAIGHAQAFIFPDEPYLIWKYKGRNNKEYFRIDNQKRTMDAAYNIYSFLINDVKDKKSDLFDKESKGWDEIKDKLREVLFVNKPIEQREELWKQKIKDGFFGFKVDIEYDDREWFKQAVEVIDKDRRIYDKKEVFHISDWKYFHDALTIHKFYIKNELLPKYGIIT